MSSKYIPVSHSNTMFDTILDGAHQADRILCRQWVSDSFYSLKLVLQSPDLMQLNISSTNWLLEH